MNSISVIMLVCDRKEFIQQAIQSVLSQTIKPKEIIKIDNGNGQSVDADLLSEKVTYYKAIPYLGVS